MEETDTKKIQKSTSGSLFVLISKESKNRLNLKKGTRIREVLDESKRRLIYELVLARPS